MDEIFAKNWMEAKKINAVQVDLHDKNFIFRVNHFAPDSVIIEFRVEQDVFELRMKGEDWDYLYEQMKRENMRQAQSKSYAKKPRPRKKKNKR